MFISEGPKYSFIILTRPAAENIVIENPHIIISVSDPCTPPTQFNPESNTVDVLRLKFHDIDRIIDGLEPITAQQASSIVDFILKYKNKIHMIVCHCEAGLSRSPGIAAALSLWLEGTDASFYKQHMPNSMVKRMILRNLQERELI